MHVFFILLLQLKRNNIYIFKILYIILTFIIDTIINIKARSFIVVFQNKVNVARIIRLCFYVILS